MKTASYFSASLLLVLISAGLCPASARAAKATQTIAFDTRSLQATLWYPDKLDVIRGVLVFTGPQGDGGSQDTRSLVDDAFWQHFAQSVGFAVLGDQFSGVYTNAAAGPGQALIDALAGLAGATQHPELAHAPLLLKGFSNGGYFSFTFAQFAPQRVIAFCLNKSGFASAPLDPAFLAIPGLLVWGSEEPATNTPTVIHALILAARPQHALWAELKEWDVGHADGSPERVYAPFFAEMIAARYPANVNPRDGDVPLIALSESAGWLGDHSDDSIDSKLPSIAAFATYAGDKSQASWLPSQAIANLWRGFVTQKPITLSRPSAGAWLDAAQPLQLTAAGLDDDQRVSFLAGSTQLSAASASTTLTFQPDSAGVFGLLALAVNADGRATATSRPAEVVLLGEPARHDDPTPDAGKADLDAGSFSADTDLDSGSTAEPGESSGGMPEPAADGGKVAPPIVVAQRARSLSGGGCSVRDANAGTSRAPAFCCALWLLVASARRRAERRPSPKPRATFQRVS